ncbi:response regulator [Falsirhodobacter halotolerans]|uniref:response regulator n=1 Tax=Falsirhodobacter halotolerans TaxID=1146892 RepID=UPI001FCFC088|nr:response regulator [Falsirhodobacter halotolerans]MCJ8140014.1 response regulator [Falsirhodobacter halotolerans]
MSYRILIVEDDTIIALDLALTLEEAGFETVGIAMDMQSALRLAERYPVDLATMDVQLARGTNGVDTAMRLRHAFDIPSVFLSANLDRTTRAQAAKARPVGFIDKPAGADAVVTFVETHFAAQTMPQ